MRNKPWTNEENLAVCMAYRIMANSTALGLPYNKSQIRRELIAGVLAGRSNGSIEAKLMNCTAVCELLGLATVPGYKAAPNYQASLVDAMRAVNDLFTSMETDSNFTVTIPANCAANIAANLSEVA